MNVTGRPAQFGRGVMVEVGGKLVDQFAVNLAKLLAGEQAGGASPAAGTSASVADTGNGAPATPAVATVPAAAAESEQEDSLNLIKLVGPAVLKRVLPIIAVAVAAVIGTLIWRRRGRQDHGGLARSGVRRGRPPSAHGAPVHRRAGAAESLDRILRNAVRGPSAGFSQGQAFLVLVGEDLKRFWDVAGAAAADTVTTAPLVIVPMSAKRVYLDRYAQPDKGWTDRDEQRWPVPFWHIDTGMAALLILLTVVDEGLGALYFGIVPEAVGPFREAFGVPETTSRSGPSPSATTPSRRRVTCGPAAVPGRGRHPLRPLVRRPLLGRGGSRLAGFAGRSPESRKSVPRAPGSPVSRPGSPAPCPGRIRAHGRIRCTGMHQILPGTRIHPQNGAAGAGEAVRARGHNPRTGRPRQTRPGHRADLGRTGAGTGIPEQTGHQGRRGHSGRNIPGPSGTMP